MEHQKRIAFFYSRGRLNDARIEYMPFGLNFLKCLDSEGYQVDAYIAETKSNAYENVFTKNVTIIFVDNDFIWNKNKGRKFYYYAKILIRLFLLKNAFKYDLIVGMGFLGNFMAAEISQKKKIRYINMGDEFPILYGDFWNEVDKSNLKKADLIIVPDESRVEGTKLIVGNDLNVKFSVLPNSPLLKDIESLPKINWHQELEIDVNKKIVLYAGGVEFFNQLIEVMVELPRWKDEYVLVINAPLKYKKEFDYYFIEGKCVWHSEPLADDKFYSLISNSFVNIGLYRTDIGYLEYVGKSSGKIMRSIACAVPVITSKMDSLHFITDLKLGVELDYTCHLPNALDYIAANEIELKNQCSINFKTTLCYDVYWEKFKTQNLIPLLNKSLRR